jgi:hypothetical protein
LGFSSSWRRVANKAQAEPPQILVGWPRSWPGWPTLGPLGLGFGPHGPRVKYTSAVMMILTFGQHHFAIP